ncbi:hypothetical protein [Lentzea sp. CC55]|uniref:hypothetical protein n=1 Tax=Lentzea sp. CC55 TaxID=2884909 RepID=UPI001F41E008|nr:hypothetical protein [Lentzea sp. CC55]MCG8921287.1 hypothetical protein [Lentzea sp. CC55]
MSQLKWDEIYKVWDQITTVSSIPLALLGFGVTIWQLIKTKSAAEAARSSAESAVHQMRRGNIIGLLRELHRVEDEIDKAVYHNSVDLLFVWLSVWRWQASELRGYLSESVGDERKVMKAIQASMTVVVNVKSSLVGRENSDLSALTAQLRQVVATVTRELGSLSVVQELDVKGNKVER